MRKREPIFQYCVVVGVVLAAAAGCGGTVAGNRVMTSYYTLASKLAACVQAHASCTSDAHDSAARQLCEDRLQSCRDAAEPAVKALGDAISACTDSDRRCRSDAGTADASIASCQEKLQACIGGAHPNGTDGTPASSGSADSALGSKCVEELHACVQMGRTPMTCAREAEQCVLDSVPTPDAATLEPRDGGHRSEDAGVDRDASRHDAAPAHSDAGTTNNKPPTSSGPSSMGTDAARPMDAGESMRHDAGRPADAGKQSPDAGCDAAMPECPDGSHGACGKQRGKCQQPGH